MLVHSFVTVRHVVRFCRRTFVAMSKNDEKWIGGLDVGTQSSRFVIFNQQGHCIAQHQVKLPTSYPNEGWVEQNPEEMFSTATKAMNHVLEDLLSQNLLSDPSELPSKLQGIGITNQRETTILWDKHSGEPLHPAIGIQFYIYEFSVFLLSHFFFFFFFFVWFSLERYSMSGYCG